MPQLRKRKTKEKEPDGIEKKTKTKDPDEVFRNVRKQKEYVETKALSKVKVGKSNVKRKKDENQLCSDEESNIKPSKSKKSAEGKTPTRRRKPKIIKEEDVSTEVHVKVDSRDIDNSTLHSSPDSGISSEALNDRVTDNKNIIKSEPSTSSVCNKLVQDGSSSESEWEEVEDCETASLDNYNPEIPKEGVEITIDCPDLRIRKRKKKEFDENEWVRLQINRVRKDIQLSIHKTHLLCLLAHGLYVNKILNCDTIKALAMSHIPDYIFSLTSGKKVDKLDIQGIDKILSWFLENFSYENTKCVFQNLFRSLVNSFETGNALNASEFNLMFIVIARSLGLKVRFCVSLYPMTYKASNLLKKPNSKKKSKKSGSNEEMENDSEDCKKHKSEKLKDNESACSKGQKKSEVKNKTNAAKPPKVKKESKTKMKKKNISETEKISRPRRSAGKSYQLSSDEDDDEKNDEDFKITDDISDDETKRPRKQNSSKRSVSNRQTNRKMLSSDSSEPSSPHRSSFDSKNIVCWVEVYSKPEKQWISIECTNNVVNKPYDVEALAPKPVIYILAYDNESYVKDVTRRYCNEYMTSTIKLRVDPDWWEETLDPFLPPNSLQNKAEEKKLNEILVNKPLPTSVQGYKNHPLYALKRHLLKFEAIYPPDAPPVGFIRSEPVYARDCVHQLHSRETWLKEARVVRIGEEPYKIVKARPKWDKIAGVLRTDLPLEVFGYWQTEQYEPPIAVDGKVPRNEYGNVELFKPCMLPRGTVHLTLPGLNRIAKKLNIDCCSAVVGFDGHKGSVHPVFDGFIICEEYKDTIIAAWDEEQENARKREEDKREKRIYGNWKKLIRGLLIRERIKLKYDTN